MRTADFDFDLPTELIAQRPAEPRDSCRLLVVERATGRLRHRHFRDIVEYVGHGDCLVLNDTGVRPARLRGSKSTGGAVEILLLRELAPGRWEALVKPGRRLPPGTPVDFPDAGKTAEVGARLEDGLREVRFEAAADAWTVMETSGELPLPPYVRCPPPDPSAYQTVYARTQESAAAPTAGLHFTTELLADLRARGARVTELTLEIGLDTFRPVTEETPEEHHMHGERFSLIAEAAAAVNQARDSGRRVFAVGTTVARALESAASETGRAAATEADTGIFILPGYRFLITDALVTNLHLPRSTPLMMVCALAGRELVLEAYREAVDRGYRFFSFGDAMLVV